MNAPDSLEDDLRTLLEPVRPELRARIAGELKEINAAMKLTTNPRSASLLAAGVMVLLAAGLFAMVRQPRQQTVVETPGNEKIAHRIPSADGGTEVAPPKPDAPPKAGDATESEESKLDRRRREAEAEAEKARAHMTELFNERVAKLLEKTGELCKREDFEAAEKLAVQILKVDPNNEAAAKLKEQAQAGARNKDDVTKLKGVILKQQQALIIEHENVERARQEKAKLEAELNAAKKDPAPVDDIDQERPRAVAPAKADSRIDQESPASPASAHLVSGKRLFSEFQYENARKELELAVRDDPKNEENLLWLARVNEILNVRRDRIKSAVAELFGEHKVAVQEKMVELDNRIDWARRCATQAQNDATLSLPNKASKLRLAQLALERARELIRWLPVEINLDEQKGEVERWAKAIADPLKNAEALLASEQPKVDEDEKSELQKKLKEKISFAVTEQALGDMMVYLAREAKITIIVDPKIVANGAEKTPITLKVSDMEVELALRWILKLADLDFIAKDNAVFVTDKATLREPVELRIYDIADLTGTEKDEKGPEIQLQATGSESDDKAANAIVETIKQHVQPDQWDPKSGVSIETMAGRLVVMQRPAVLRFIDQFLDGLRKKKNKLAKTVAYHVKNLKDPDPDIRQESCAMLEALGSADAVPELIEVLDPARKEKDPVRIAAHKALRKISGKNFELADYTSWKDWWKSVAKPERKDDK